MGNLKEINNAINISFHFVNCILESLLYFNQLEYQKIQTLEFTWRVDIGLQESQQGIKYTPGIEQTIYYVLHPNLTKPLRDERCTAGTGTTSNLRAFKEQLSERDCVFQVFTYGISIKTWLSYHHQKGHHWTIHYPHPRRFVVKAIQYKEFQLSGSFYKATGSVMITKIWDIHHAMWRSALHSSAICYKTQPMFQKGWKEGRIRKSPPDDVKGPHFWSSVER